MTLEKVFAYEDINEQLTPGMRYTIYVIWKFFLYRKYIGKPTREFSYIQLQAYYGRFKFKIIPRALFRRGRPLHWHTIERAIRSLKSDIDPPLLFSIGNGFFQPTQAFWDYIKIRLERHRVFWPELRYKGGG